VLPRLEAGLEDEAGRVAQPLGVVAVPCVDMAEVEHLRHARRRRREEAGRDAVLLVELDAVEHVRADVPRVGGLAGEQHLPEPNEAVRVVELVAVESERPEILARALLDQVVRLAGLLHAVERGRDRALGGQPLEDLGRRVTRAVVDEDQLVAEAEDVPHGLLDEAVLVAEEADPDDRRHAASVGATG